MKKALKGLLILSVFLAGCGSGGGGGSAPVEGACVITATYDFGSFTETIPSCSSLQTEESCKRGSIITTDLGNVTSATYKFHPGKTCADIGY